MKIIPVRFKEVISSPFSMVKDLTKMVRLAFTPTAPNTTAPRVRKTQLASEPMYKPSRIKVGEIKKKLDAIF